MAYLDCEAPPILDQLVEIREEILRNLYQWYEKVGVDPLPELDDIIKDAFTMPIARLEGEG